MVAGTHSGVGKTTVATGLMAALARRGRRVGAAKVGPDFIDPGYHSIAIGRSSRNLDAWMCGEAAVARGASAAAKGCDVLLIEGVMGLWDGAGGGSFASTAHVANLLAAPVVLVVDAASMSGSVAALVHGFASYRESRPGRVAGVILNRVGSDGHEAMLREALAPVGIPVLGALRRDDALAWRDRHLGLVPVVEHPGVVRSSVDRLAAVMRDRCDLDAIEALASSAPPMAPDDVPTTHIAPRARVAVASGAAFSFMYPDNLEALEAAGAEVVPFDPLAAGALPDNVDGLVVGGGFPEVFAANLGGNTSLLADVRTQVTAGLATWAECGGLLWLCRSLDGVPMAGVIDAHARMTSTLTLGYREATIAAESAVGPPGTRLRGHEFHYSTIDPAGTAMHVTGRGTAQDVGFATPTLLASYVHVHLASDPSLAARFVDRAARRCRDKVGVGTSRPG